jgi:hypothetical protein
MIILTQYKEIICNHALMGPLLPASSIRLGGASTLGYSMVSGYRCSVLSDGTGGKHRAILDDLILPHQRRR